MRFHLLRFALASPGYHMVASRQRMACLPGWRFGRRLTANHRYMVGRCLGCIHQQHWAIWRKHPKMAGMAPGCNCIESTRNSGRNTYGLNSEINMSTVRQLHDPIGQGIDETVIYSVDMTALGTPTTPTAKAWKVITDANYTDVTTTIMPTGSCSVSGNTITLPGVKSLSLKNTYRIVITAAYSGGNTLSGYFDINGEK
jgi:hypothetical protein